jgi:hypothetical protein
VRQFVHDDNTRNPHTTSINTLRIATHLLTVGDDARHAALDRRQQLAVRVECLRSNQTR